MTLKVSKPKYKIRRYFIGSNLIFLFFTAQCTLVHMRGLGIACRPSVRLSVRPSVCNVGGL